MAVRIRLSRCGRRNRPYYRIVAIDQRTKRDGKALDVLGTYDPIRHVLLSSNPEKLEHWKKVGAQCSDSAKKFVKMIQKTQASVSAS